MRIKRFKDLNEASKEQIKIDELLDKIKTLTPDEKNLLDRLSKGEKLDEQKPISKTDIFKEGDRVTYLGNTTGYNGKKAKFIRMKEEGKCSIQFDDGKKLIINMKNIMPSKIDPYGEEDWCRTEKEERLNNVPGDFYFHVGDTDDGICVTLTYIDFFNEHGYVADDLGSYNLSQNVINALNNSGVYGDGEIMEAVWEARRGFTVEQIKQNMIQAGFVQNDEFDNFLNNL
jgi:hypothetical protein